MFPFDSKIACLCQSIEINNNKYVYRQSQVRMPNGSGVRWAECLLIMGTGCRVQVFSLILDSSVGLSAGIQSAEDWVSETPGFESYSQQRMTTCFLSIRKSLACARASKLTTTNMYIYTYIYVYIYIFMFQVLSLILDSSVGLSASIQSAGDLVSGTPGSNPAFRRGTQLVSFRFEYRLPVPEHRN